MTNLFEPQPFDVCGPLPTGVTVLEASAGTGKTYTIANLAGRYVAEGRPLEELLLVTFTRMATGELRERVRDRLVSAEDGLDRALHGVPPAGDDDVLQLLIGGTVEELEERRRRLARALTDFDAATITTTHGFCDQVLTGLGVAGDIERDVTFVEDLGDLVEEVVDDFYVRKFHRGGRPPFGRDEALQIARKAVENSAAPLEPVDAPDQSPPAMRQRFAVNVRAEVERRKRRAGVVTYDDLLTRLRSTLADEARGPTACARLRSRYRVAMVDEFQDTDPVQWDIMRLAFGANPPDRNGALVLIGDPKQAIYAFRGADVYAYLDAAGQAETRATLETNWRSDKGLLDAFDAMFGGARLGHEGIPYRRVAAAGAHTAARLVGAPVETALRLRVVHRADGHVELTNNGYVRAVSGRRHVAEDLAADLVRLLSSPAEIVTRRPDGSEAGRRRACPGDVAVLVRYNYHAAEVREALEAVGIPAVINGAGSVFGTPTAREWLRLLEAIERPTSPTRAASAALTVFFGWTAAAVASADERAWEEVHTRLHRWAALLRRRGVASLLEAITITEGLPARVLARTDGERELTDLRHAGQLLHAAATSGQLGVTALTAWLRQRVAEAGRDTGNEERSRRLESDAEAVQVLTIHRSKGLEFPIVYYPFLWDGPFTPEKAPPVFHDAANTRTIDVGGPGGRGFARHSEQALNEERGEDLRLAYVALTRAKHQAVVWWAGSWDGRNSVLSRLLFARDAAGTVAPEAFDVPDDALATARFAELARAAPHDISLERSGGRTGAVWAGEPRDGTELAAGRFDRVLDGRWRRTSYSGIVAGTHEARVASEPDQPVISDEEGYASVMATPVGVADAAAGDEARLRAVPASLASTPGGMDVGTLIHSVLEASDFTAEDLDAELTGHVARQQERQRVDLGEPAAVVAGLRAAIDTPLGPLVDGLRLRDVGRTDRVDEMGFELPLAGGERPTADVSVLDIASILRRHLPAGDAFAAYGSRLADPALHGDLRGYLAGSVDLVLRASGGDGTPRFTVVDYKTNWLGADGTPLSAWHYRPAALIEEMERAHYPLQALLYTVALHRHLRWRLPGYDPERNLAGVLYLFLRGMTGADTPCVGTQPCGVLAWRPPPSLVEILSDVLDRGAAAQ